VAKEKQLNFAVAIIAQPEHEHEQANNETHAALDTSKEQGRPAW